MRYGCDRVLALAPAVNLFRLTQAYKALDDDSIKLIFGELIFHIDYLGVIGSIQVMDAHERIGRYTHHAHNALCEGLDANTYEHAKQGKTQVHSWSRKRVVRRHVVVAVSISQQV